MTVREPGKNLTPQQTRLNSVVNSTERQLGREVEALVVVEPNELFALVAVSSGKDIVAANGGQLIQLPGLFDTDEDHDYLRLREVVVRSGLESKKLNIYFVYQILGPQRRTAACMIAVKKTTEPMADIKFYELNQRVANEDNSVLATATLGDQSVIKIMGVRSHKQYVAGSEAKLFAVVDSLHVGEKVATQPRSVDQVWNA
jgi:hypothetical protein